MRLLITLFTIVLIVGAVSCKKKSKKLPILEVDPRYWNWEVLPGRAARLVCLEENKLLDNNTDMVYFDWFYEEKPMNFSDGDDRWLDDGTRTLVIPNARKVSEGRYRCVCIIKKTGKPCMGFRYHRKKSKKTGKKGKKRKVGRVPLEQRTALLVQKPEKVGDCIWTNFIPKPRVYKYDMRCRCYGGSDFVCGSQMLIQRQDRGSKKWMDVEMGRFHYGGMSFYKSSNSMEITGFGVNVTFEASGFYRCIAYKHEDILCQSDAVPIEPDFPPVPSLIPEINDHLLWIGGPLLAIFTFVLSFVCGRMLYYCFTSRIVVQAKNSKLIPKYIPEEAESVESVESNPPSQAKSSSSIHLDISTPV